MINLNEYIIKFLEKNNFKVVFSYPGYTSLPLYLNLKQSKLKHVLVRHEQSAAHAADAYIRTSNSPCVCFGSSGPGSTNLITGIGTAFADSIPLLVIVGSVYSKFYKKNSFQEANIVDMVKTITKKQYYLGDYKKIDRVLSEAFTIANSGKKGPVLIQIPIDYLESEKKLFNIPKKINLKEKKKKINKADQTKIINKILSSKKPVFLVGRGARKSYKEIRFLAKKLDIPVVHTVSGAGVMDSNEILFGGLLRHNGSRVAATLIQNSDLIIVLGSSLDNRCTLNKKTFAPKSEIIHIDIIKEEFNKNIQTDLNLNISVKIFTDFLKNKFKNKIKRTEWINTLLELKKYDDLIYKNTKSQFVHPKTLMKEINELTKNAVIVSGAGEHKYWALNNITLSKPNNFITTARFGCVGFGLPAAIGVSLARKKENVILISGDGDLQMSIQELITAKENNCNLKIIIFNNHGLKSTQNYQMRRWKMKFGTEFKENADFVKIGHAYGIKSYDIKNEIQLKKIKKLLTKNGLMIFNINIDPNIKIIPWTHPDYGSLEDIKY